MKCKVFAILFFMLMLCQMVSPGLAAEESEKTAGKDAAESLYDLGLFKGVGTDDSGNPIFALEKSATRAEMCVMLLRLLGKEEEAKVGSWTVPFTDLDGWELPYVGYAYNHGLINGVSATTFDPNSKVTATQYLTVVLRSMGYSDAKGDFSWDKAWELSDQIGLTHGEYSADSNTLIRSNMADISYTALQTPVKDSEESLYKSAYGVDLPVKSEAAEVMEETPVNLPDNVKELASGLCGIDEAEDGLYWILYDNGLLYIGGHGKMIDGMGDFTPPWYSYRKQIKRVFMQNGVTSVGYRAFFECSNLVDIRFSPNTESISSFAFARCDSLTTVTLPDALTTLSTLYPACSLYNEATQEFVISSKNATFSTKDGVLLDKAQTTVICCPNGKTGQYIVPSSVTKISSFAFENSSLSSILLPAGLSELGKGVFRGSDLTDIILPAGIHEIPEQTFAGCEYLTTISCAGQITDIGYAAFNLYISVSVKPGESYEDATRASIEKTYSIHFTGDAPAVCDKTAFGSGFVIYYPASGSGWDAFSKQSFADRTYLVFTPY